MERPQKPQLEYQQRVDGNGVLVQELTAESERVWSNYLREDQIARAAIYRRLHAGEEDGGVVRK